MTKWRVVLVLSAFAVLAFASVASAALEPTPTPVPGDTTPDYTSPTTVGTVEGTNIIVPTNPANTPTPTTPGQGRIHTQFQTNTNACASCHAAHTAVGKDLLQWADVNATCRACHDGTVTTTYNVELGQIASTGKRTFGGLFKFASADQTNDLSRHGVTDVGILANAAPGGAMLAGAADDPRGQWTAEFTCASCHSPHGQGGNARILAPDPNGVVTQLVDADHNKQQDATSPYKSYTLTRNETVPGAVYYEAVVGTSGDFKLGYMPGEKYTFIKGYPYSSYTAVYVGGVKQAGTAYKIDNSQGSTRISFTTDPGAIATVTADFAPAMRVKMGVTAYLTATESVAYKGGLNAFCGACHTDYNTATASLYNSPTAATGRKDGLFHGAATTLTGSYRDAYRHQVGYNYGGAAGIKGLKFEAGQYYDPASSTWKAGNIVVCLTCHVAHGTDQQYWIDSLAGTDKNPDGTDFWTATTALETDHKSVLKRKPNMAVCESCHQKGAGNDGYSFNTQ